MPNNVEIDFSEFEKSINRAYQMGEIRKRDITKVFRDADRSLIRTMKSFAPRGKKDVISKKYPSRSHKRGNLRREIKFKTSRKYKLVYYVNPGAYYTIMYVGGHGSWTGNNFIERAIESTKTQVTGNIKDGLTKLTIKEWKNG